MKDCKVIFFGSQTSEVSGKIGREGGSVILEFAFEGDDIQMTCSENVIAYSRRGSLTLDMVFEKDICTLCTIKEGGLTGEMPVFTQRLDFKITPKGADIYLKYDLCGELKELRVSAEELSRK